MQRQHRIENMKRTGLLLTLFLSLLIISSFSPPSRTSSTLEAGFKDPPASAKPRVWWHWMNGNITKEGIRADLEWMHRVGIGGFQNFDAALTTPQIVDKRLVYMTQEWKDAFRFTTRLADSLGLEMAIAGSPGWSESGGPWVKPEQAMKKYVWSEITVEAGKPFNGHLPKPPSVTGLFQNVPMAKDPSPESIGNSELPPLPAFYADIAVTAFRLPEGDQSLTDLNPKVTSSGGNFTLEGLTDGDVATMTELPYLKPGEFTWIQYEFAAPQTFRAMSVASIGTSSVISRFLGGGGNKILEISDDGKTFKTVVSIPDDDVQQVTLFFPPATAKFFRFSVKTPPPAPDMSGAASLGLTSVSSKKYTGTPVAEWTLSQIAKVNHFEDKAGFTTSGRIAEFSTPSSTNVVKKTDVVDLTSKMNPDGILNWVPPAGKWIILRFGYSLKGTTNHPASPEATGLEVDKLDAGHVKDYFTKYLDQYKDATNGLMGRKGLQYIITDSWEAGAQNWTGKIMEEFLRRRGYDMTLWLPVMAGYVLESSEASDHFLWDFRRTLADLVAENHYDQLTRLLKERGMGRYSESHEGSRAIIADGMEVKRTADIPMSATWAPNAVFGGSDVSILNRMDVRESSSVSHIYGKKLVAAESLTSIMNAWGYYPENLKPVADMEMAMGLNRFVIHCSVHQPLDNKIPGLSLGPFGQYFTRHETWAEQAGPWMTYLARSSYMLQQGQNIADVIYFYGEDNNITSLFEKKMPDVPEGYNYDFVNADALVNVLSVKNGNIITLGGSSYRVLALDANCRQMSLPVLRKISQMVNAGAIVVGEKPAETPSLSDDPAEFKTIADQLWPGKKGENNVGKGKTFTGITIKEVLDILNIKPDFVYDKPKNDTKLMFVHHKVNDLDFYWVNNRNARVENLDATFRVAGREVEIWQPVTGEIKKASYKIQDGTTVVSISMDPADAFFVVFRKKAKDNSQVITKSTEEVLSTIEGPWTVNFQEKRGAPVTATFQTLSPWNENADKGVKYFSGTATYSENISANSSWFAGGKEIWIELGSVKNLAEVVVNGKSLGIIWKAPFKVNITNALISGENRLEIKVTNLWVNRLIGDTQPDVTEKITWTSVPFYQANSPLQPSGLLGPVRIINRTGFN
jgi:hypothetical protein